MKLEKSSVKLLRKKTELHFDNYRDIQNLCSPVGTIEVHYKCRKRNIFQVAGEQIEELNKKKMALSFNASTKRPIVSFRFCDAKAYRKGKLNKPLPWFLSEEEREIVLFDTNQKLDSFWPMRTGVDKKLSPDLFPTWAVV